MKRVEAIVRPERLEAVKEALIGLGHKGLTVDRGQGPRHPEGHHAAVAWRGVRHRPAAEGLDRRGRQRPRGRRRGRSDSEGGSHGSHR